MSDLGAPDAQIVVDRFGAESAVPPPVVIAIPVKNEEERIGLCLQALAGQEGFDMASAGVVLLLNNCTDATMDAVRALQLALPFMLQVHRVDLPPAFANAGWARKLAMDAAAAWVADDGLILTTDADTMAHEDWVAANLKEIAAGHDAVAGYVMADPMEVMQLPAAVLERGGLEWEYQQLAAELDARADPEPHDPWPRHSQNCGASAAVTARAYRAIGGLPPRPVGEDRALFEMIRRIDGRVRHSLEVQVVTSARQDGRAFGGLADEIRLRRTDVNHPCDEALEVAVTTLRRALWRSALRRAWTGRTAAAEAGAWAERLRIPVETMREALARNPAFGAFWAELEAVSPRLKRRLVTGAELKRELRRMRRLVESARHRAKAAAAEAALADVRAA